MLHSSISENGTRHRKVIGMLVAAVLAASTLSFVGTGGYYNAYAQVNSNNNGNNNDIDVQVTKPSPELTAEWWQWALSFPVDENPILDTTGEDCSKGDVSDDVFFLAGTAGGKVERVHNL